MADPHTSTPKDCGATMVPVPTSMTAQLLGEGPVRTVPLPDAEPPERISGLAGEYISLSIVGGLAAGLIVGALWSKSKPAEVAPAHAPTPSLPDPAKAVLHKLTDGLLEKAVKWLILRR